MPESKTPLHRQGSFPHFILNRFNNSLVLINLEKSSFLNAVAPMDKRKHFVGYVKML